MVVNYLRYYTLIFTYYCVRRMEDEHHTHTHICLSYEESKENWSECCCLDFQNTLKMRVYHLW